MVKTTTMMNKEIVAILRWTPDNPAALYAAQRIEELEAELKAVKHNHQEELNRLNGMIDYLMHYNIEAGNATPHHFFAVREEEGNNE